MTISRLQDWTESSANGASPLTLTLVSNPSQNSIVVLFIGIDTATEPLISITDNFGDSGGGSWAYASTQINYDNAPADSWIAWRQIGSGASNKVITCNYTNTGICQLAAAEYGSDVAGTWVADGTNTAINTTSADPSPGGITTTKGNGVVVGQVYKSGAAPTAGSGFSSRLTLSGWFGAGAIEDQIFTSNNTYTAGWTATSSLWSALASAIGFTASSSDVTVGATGSQVAASQGNLNKQISIGLTGNQIVASPGSEISEITLGLSGNAISASQGTVVADTSDNITVGATGTQIAASQGTLATQLSVGLTGSQIALSEGLLSTSIFSNISVTADEIYLYVTFDTSIDLSSGIAGFSYSINSPTTAPLTWWTDEIGVVTHQGLTIPWSDLGAVSGNTIYVDVGYSLTNPAGDKVYASDEGVGVSSVVVSTSDVTVGLTGQQISNSLGTLGLGISIPLFGSQVEITTGTVTPGISGNITIALIGKLITVQQGNVHVLGVGGHYYPSTIERRRKR